MQTSENTLETLQNLKLDLVIDGRDYIVIHQGDIGVHTITAKVSMNGESFSLDPNTYDAILSGTRPDGVMVYELCTINDNTISVTLPAYVSDINGVSEYRIDILDCGKERMASSNNFRVQCVKRSLKDASIIKLMNTPTYTILVQKLFEIKQAIIKVEELKKDYEEKMIILDQTIEENRELNAVLTQTNQTALETIDDMNELHTTVSQNETIREDNEAIRITNENARIEAEKIRIANEDARKSAETQRVEIFNQTITDCETATGNANTAAQECYDAIGATGGVSSEQVAIWNAKMNSDFSNASTDLPVNKGGTGANTASGARTNLGITNLTIISTTAPSDVTALWLDKSLAKPTLKFYNGSAWIPITSDGGIYRGSSTPTDTNVLWINTSTGITKYHNGSSWVNTTSTWG